MVGVSDSNTHRPRARKTHYSMSTEESQEEHADVGNQFIPVRSRTSDHTTSMKVLMKFAQVVIVELTSEVHVYL